MNPVIKRDRRAYMFPAKLKFCAENQQKGSTGLARKQADADWLGSKLTGLSVENAFSSEQGYKGQNPGKKDTCRLPVSQDVPNTVIGGRDIFEGKDFEAANFEATNFIFTS